MTAAPFAPSGVVSLTTDFGTSGPYVGALHGVILSRHPAARIVDLTHDIEVHWPAEAGFWLERTYRHFPPGTVHVAVVESGMRTERAGVVVVLDGHAFVGPDNGLLAPLAEMKTASVHAIEPPVLRGLGLERASSTFRGRDVQAPVGGAIAAGRIAPEAVGGTVEDWVPQLIEAAQLVGGEIQGIVITVDSFGNVITNVPTDLVAHIPGAEVVVGGRSFPLRGSYDDGEPGSLVGLINAFGVLEIARLQRSAADQLGIGRGAPITVRRRIHRD